jgi:phage terminase Nu1 subunit (DNA packaging protein)
MKRSEILLLPAEEYYQFKDEILSRLDDIYRLIQSNSNYKSRDDDLLDIVQLTKILGISKTTVHALKRKGLPFKKIGGKLRFDLTEIKSFINNKNLKK